MRAALLISSLFALAACDRDKGQTGQDSVAEQDGPFLELRLSATATTAGEPVSWSLYAVYPDGGEELVTGALSDDLESGLDWDADSLTPTLAGEHVITASAEVDGGTLTDDEGLTVGAGAATSLDLILDSSTVIAGEELGFTISGVDVYGNAIDGSTAEVVASSSDISVGSASLSGLVTGAYSLNASDNGHSDTEYFQVLPADPVSVSLTLSDMDIELGDSTTATVDILDAYGNATDDPYTLSVTGGEGAVISGLDIRFDAEGLFTVRVDVDDTDLWDEVGPLVVDSSGPDLIVDVPERGAWSDGLSGTVSGTVDDEVSGLGGLTVNGEPVATDVDGSFSTDMDWDFGLNIIETNAVDGDGNEVTDTRAVLAGDFLSYGSAASGGMLARINEGAGGLDELEALADGLVVASDLDDLIPSPAYSYEEESCWTVFGYRYCITWYSVTLYLKNPSLSGTDLQLDPLSTGQLQATFAVTDPTINWTGTGVVAEIDYSGSGSVKADRIDVTLLLTPTVSSGKISATVDSVSVVSTGFDFDVDSWLYDALEYVGIDFDSLVQGYLEDAIEGVVNDEVPSLIEETFQDLAISTSFDLLDRTYTLAAKPDGISVDDTGLSLSLATTFTPDTVVLSDMGEGSLYYGYSQPTWAGATGTDLGVSDDFLNQVFYALWLGGVLDLELTDEELGLDPADLALVLPDLTDLTVTTEPLLPPVVVPGTGAETLDLGVGDMLLTLYNGPAEPGYEYIQVYVSVVAGLDVSVADGTNLSATIGDTDLYFDVVYPEAGSKEAAAIEDLLSLLVPALLPSLTDGLAEVPIPDISGFTLSDITVGVDGAESGYVAIGGNLEAL